MALGYRDLRLAVAILIGLVLVINHQGCGDSAFLTDAPGTAMKAEPPIVTIEDGGDTMIHLTAYYVEYGDCSANDNRSSVIRLRAGEYTLLRDECKDLDRPLPLRGGEVQTDPNNYNQYLTFNGREYLKESYD